jgi:hypothetical protein
VSSWWEVRRVSRQGGARAESRGREEKGGRENVAGEGVHREHGIFFELGGGDADVILQLSQAKLDRI